MQFDFKNTWIVVPAYNEQLVLPTVIEDLAVNCPGARVLIVDDGSIPPVTCGNVSRIELRICRHPFNLGQGAAIATGIAYALRHGAAYIVTFDADGQHCARDVISLLTPLIQSQAQVSLGSRFLTAKSVTHVPPLKRVVLYLAIAFTRVTTGLALTDTHNGFRAFTRSAASAIRLTEPGMAHASQILEEIARCKISYKEVPVTVLYTDYSVAKGQRIYNALNILFDKLLRYFNL